MTLVSLEWLEAAMAAILEGAGLAAEPAARVSHLMAEANARGSASHGAILLPMYVERLRAGSVLPEAHGEVVVDAGAVAVVDAGRILGHLSSVQAMVLAIVKARQFGIGAVTSSSPSIRRSSRTRSSSGRTRVCWWTRS